MQVNEFFLTNSPDYELIEKRSRFLGVAFFLSDESQVKTILQELRANHPQANHVCFAFQLGTGNTKIHGMSDDGEPKGTAGRPILEVLKGSGITNCLLVIVRYFGGTKLGTGGLVKAYGECAKGVLNKADREQIVSRETFLLQIGYEHYQKIRSWLDEAEARDLHETFWAEILMTGNLPVEQWDRLESLIQDYTRGQSKLVLKQD